MKIEKCPRMRQFRGILSLVWQVPLTTLSFLFYRVTRCGIRCLVRFITKQKNANNKDIRWVTVSEILMGRFGLPHAMVTGPRWNCHAVLGAAGPLKVRSSIEVDIETANQSAREWTLVIYDQHTETRSFLGSRDLKSDKKSKEIQVKPGIYVLLLRYYHCHEESRLPAIKVDGVEQVPARNNSDEWQAYQAVLEKYRNYRGWFYYALHYYVFNLLQWRSGLSASFVRKEFLPVGNPETHFLYGIARKGEHLAVDINPGLLDQVCVYITFDNKHSFPVFWEEITNEKYESQVVPCDGYYLIRVHQKENSDCQELHQQVRCNVLS